MAASSPTKHLRPAPFEAPVGMPRRGRWPRLALLLLAACHALTLPCCTEARLGGDAGGSVPPAEALGRSPGHVSVVANPNDVPADGNSLVQITATYTSAHGAPLSGQTLTFSSDDFTDRIAPRQAVTDCHGQASTTFAAIGPGLKQLYAGPGSQRLGSAQVSFACVGNCNTVLRADYVAQAAEVQNPERGLLNPWAGGLAPIDPNRPLVRYLVDWSAYCNTATLPPGALTGLQQDFNRLRAAGTKAVLRLVYATDVTNACGWFDAASTTLMAGHLQQITPILAGQRDVVAFVEAGLLGRQGLWLDDAAQGSDAPHLATDATARQQAVDLLLEAVPPDRRILLPSPAFRARLNDGPVGRIGFEDPNFLTSPTDGDTYGSPAELTATESLMEAMNQGVPMGGEVGIPGSPNRLSCATALSTMAAVGTTYLTDNTHPAAFNLWHSASPNCYSTVAQRLGYRYVVQQVAYSAGVRPTDSQVSVAVTLTNVGFAPIYNPRRASIVLTDAQGQVVAVPQVSAAHDDMTLWAAGQTLTLTSTLYLPPGLVPGPYGFALSMPDASGNKAFAVRLASDAAGELTGPFDAAQGVNHLRAGFTVDGIVPTPPPSSAPTQFLVSGYASPATAGVPSSVTVTALDAFGAVVSGYEGTVRFTSNDPQATLPADVALVGGVSGPLPATLRTATASGQIDVVDVETGSISGNQNGIVVGAAAAAQLAVAGYSSPAVAGVPQTVTVTARDAFGNVAQDYRGTVHFTSNDDAAALPGDLIFTGGMAGVSPAQGVTLETATATGSITATDRVQSGISGTQSPIQVGAAAAATLTVAGFPSLTVAGTPGTVTVTARDAFGNVAQDYRGTVQFTSSDGAAVLPGNVVFTGGMAGVSPAQSVTLKTPTTTGSITATDLVQSGISGTQTPIQVGVAAVASFVVTGFPSPTVAGTPGTLTVTAHDAFGNVASDYRGTVRFTSNDAAAVLPGNLIFTAGMAGLSPAQGATLKTATPTGSITAIDIVQSGVSGTQTPIQVAAAAVAALTVTGFPNPAVAGTPGSLTVTARDAFGNVASDYRGTVTFSSSDLAGALPADVAFAPGDAGLHSALSVTLKTVTDTASVTASDRATPSLSGVQAPIVVLPGAVAGMVVAGYSCPAVAGVPSTFNVVAIDAFNNVASGYLGTVRFTSNDLQAVLPAPATFVAGDAGVLSGLGATLKTATTTGSITAIDVATPGISGAQQGITIVAAATSGFQVAGHSSPSVAGVGSSITVRAQDPFANVTSTYAGTVSFSSNDSLAVLPENYVFVSGTGVSAARPVTLKIATATASITAVDVGNPAMTGVQAPIVVVPAAAVGLVVAGYSCPAVAGVPGSIDVAAVDAFDNVASGYLGTVRFTSNDPQGTVPAPTAFVAANAGVLSGVSATLKTATLAANLTAVDVADSGITGNQNSIVVVPAAPASFTISGYTTPSIAGVGSTVTVMAKDAYSNLATGYRGTVAFISNDVQAVLPAKLTFTAGMGGISQPQAVTLRTATVSGSVQATDVNHSSVTGSQLNITILATYTAQLTVTGFPCPAVYRTQQTVKVIAMDPYDNLASDYRGTVAITTNNPNSTLPPTYVFLLANQGVSSNQNITLATLGDGYSITATDIDTPSIYGSQGNITITAGLFATGWQSAARFDPSPPSGTVQGVFGTSDRWTHYVQEAVGWQAAGQPCDADDPTMSCVHAAEVHAVQVPGVPGCHGLVARDRLQAFDWRCEERAGAVWMISTGLKGHRRVGDLIDWHRKAWRANAVTVSRDGQPLWHSAATAWWDNAQIKPWPQHRDADCTLLREAGVYLLESTARRMPIRRVTLGQDHIALIVHPDVYLEGSAPDAQIRASRRAFTWVEGRLHDVAVQQVAPRWAVIRHLTARQQQLGVAVDIAAGRHVRLQHLDVWRGGRASTKRGAHAPTGLILDLRDSTVEHILFNTPGEAFIDLSGAHNRLADVCMAQGGRFSLYSDAAAGEMPDPPARPGPFPPCDAAGRRGADRGGDFLALPRRLGSF